MKSDYDIIKDKFSERMAKACRSLFPTLFEKEGEISKIMLENFYPNPTIYQDLVLGKTETFKNYIYSFYDIKAPEVKTDKTVEELMDEAGYKIYECHNEDEISAFKKYYRKNEALCSFHQNRLASNYVFFAIKKNVDEIKREDFIAPAREDEYGTSVISLQFAKGKMNPVSIKNRYNHKVNNPDSTFENNLENIIPGLTNAFEKEYGLNITRQEQEKEGLKIFDYTLADDGRYYKYNYEIDGICYCPNNIMINNGKVFKADSSRYKILDYLLIDYKEKSIKPIDTTINEGFKYENLKKIDVRRIKETKNTRIDIVTEDDKRISILSDESNRMISLFSEDIKELPDCFLNNNKYLETINLPNVKSIGNGCLYSNERLISLNLPKAVSIGDDMLINNNLLLDINLPEVLKIGDRFLYSNEVTSNIYAPKCELFGDECFFSNNSITSLSLPSTHVFGDYFFGYNETIKNINMPNLTKIGFDPFGGKVSIYEELLEVINKNGRKVDFKSETETNEATSTKQK